MDLFPISVVFAFLNKCNVMALSILARIALHYVSTRDSVCGLGVDVFVAVLESSFQILVYSMVYGSSKNSHCHHCIS